MSTENPDRLDMHPSRLRNEYGYTLLHRNGQVEIWREKDDRLMGTRPTFLEAFQWAYYHPHVLGSHPGRRASGSCHISVRTASRSGSSSTGSATIGFVVSGIGVSTKWSISSMRQTSEIAPGAWSSSAAHPSLTRGNAHTFSTGALCASFSYGPPEAP